MAGVAMKARRLVVRGAVCLGMGTLPVMAGSSPAASQDPAAQEPSAASPAQAARQAFNRLVSAANRLDADAEGRLFWRSHELVSVAQGTPTLGWESRDRNARQWYASLQRQKIRVEDVQIRALGPDAVALTASYRQEITAKDGRDWKGRGVWSLVYRRIEGEWLAAYEHYSYEE